MIFQKDFLNKLKDFGLNSYEAKLWLALLSRGVSTAGELSDMANVPRSRSYDVLESLEKKGFIIMRLGKPIKYIAVPPLEVVDRIKKKLQEESTTQSKLLESLKGSDTLTELTSLHTTGINLVDPADLTGAIKGRSTLYDHLHSQMKNAKKSVCIMTTELGLSRKADSLIHSLQKAKANGAKVRIIAPLSKSNVSAIKKLSEVASVRNAEGHNMRMCIIDGKQVTMMPLDDASTHPTYDFGVWANSEFFSKGMEKIFDVVWNSAKEA